MPSTAGIARRMIPSLSVYCACKKRNTAWAIVSRKLDSLATGSPLPRLALTTERNHLHHLTPSQGSGDGARRSDDGARPHESTWVISKLYLSARYTCCPTSTAFPAESYATTSTVKTGSR